MPIRRLPPLLIDQIAAGEVIERPASVVKELVENAVDAGASRIVVRIEGGGRERIAVTDDGHGIPPDELPLALAPHATSKIEAVDDLEAIATMGFRGEALASIASVAQVTITSRTRDAEAASRVEADAGELGPVRPCPGPPGTTVEVRQLFHRVPARRRFLKSDQAESTRVAETMRSLALAHPTIALRLEVDGRERFDFPPATEAIERVIDVLGREFEPHLLPVEHDEAGVRVRGLIGTPELAKSTARSMRSVLNGRPIADRTVHHAMREGYRGLIEPGKSPVAVLYLQVDPRRVDVNVHPAKSEVRFRDGAAVHAAVRHALKGALAAADIVPAVDLRRAGSDSAPGGGPADGRGGELGRGEGDGGAWVETMGERRGAGVPGSAATGSGAAGSAATNRGATIGAASGGHGDRAVGRAPSGPVRLRDLAAQLAAPGAEDATRAETFDRVAQAVAGDGADASGSTEPAPDRLTSGIARHAAYLQVHDSFLVVQDEQGLLVIDQHALHERVMFEVLRERVSDGPLESQRLLVPEVVDVPEAHMEALDALGPLFAQLGFETAPLGRASVGVQAVPTLLVSRKVDIASFVQELMARTAEEDLPPGTEAALAEVLDMMACKAALKAGEKLSPDDVAALLEARARLERGSSCPHGRPTTLRLTVEDLERQFGRR